MSLRNHRDIRKYFETNEQGSTTYQYFWDAAKAALQGTCITTHTDIKAQERFNSLTLQLKELEKGEQPKFKASTKREIIKIRAEIGEMENRKTAEKTNKTKSWVFRKISKIDKPLPRTD